MRTELKDIANTGGRNRTIIWRERPLLDCLRIVGNDDLVDLVEGETRDLDRCIFEDQLPEFDLELVEIPFTLFREPIDGESKLARGTTDLGGRVR